MSIQDTNKYVFASLAGAGRGFLGLVIEHPLDTIKTRRQADPMNSTAKITKMIYQEGGIRGFYSGALPNGIRLIGKQTYRWPMMVALPLFFREALPPSIQKEYPSSVKISTGLTIASFETFLICPLERLKVHFMTSEQKGKKIRRFFADHTGNLSQELGRGLNAVYAKQTTIWVTFLVADEKFKNWERKRIRSEELPLFSLLKVSCFVGSTMTAVNMPFDVVKTNLQKQNHLANEGVFNTIRKIYQMNGIRGLYAGWQVRMIQYMIQSTLTVTFLERLEHSFK